MKKIITICSFIVVLSLNIVILPYVFTVPLLILITLYLLFSRLYNFQYIAIVLSIGLFSITPLLLIFNINSGIITTAFLKSILSIFIISSVIQNIKIQKTINIYLLIVIAFSIFLGVSTIMHNIFHSFNIPYGLIFFLIIVMKKKLKIIPVIFLIYTVFISSILHEKIYTENICSNVSLLVGSIIGFQYLHKKTKPFNTLYIHGLFLTQTVTGVQRVCIEFCKRLEKKKLPYDIIILVPNNVNINLYDINITIRKIGKFKGFLWEQITLPLYLLFKRNSELLCLDNRSPLLYPGIVMLHDIRFFENGYDKGKWKFGMCVINTLNMYRYNKILTVSNFSKKRIEFFFNSIILKNIYVCYIANDHVLNCTNNNKYEIENYYLSVSSIMKHKNFQFILDLAYKLPQEKFLIIGKSERVKEYFVDIPTNVLFTGYVSDEELSSFYRNCKGFISSSFYEGFGLTPLEALGFGCKKIFLSNIEVFHEIYENVAIFFDDVDDLISKLDYESTDDIEINNLLNKYTWNNFTYRVIEALDI